MPDSFEYFVRPYQSPGAHGVTVIPSTPQGTRETATLTWGAKSNMPEVQGGISVTCCSDTLNELSRESDTVRIYQPGEAENYVDVARARKLKLDKQDKNTCASDWNQMSYAAAAVDAALAEFVFNFDDVQNSGKCGATWNLKNER